VESYRLGQATCNRLLALPVGAVYPHCFVLLLLPLRICPVANSSPDDLRFGGVGNYTAFAAASVFDYWSVLANEQGLPETRFWILSWLYCLCGL